MAGYTVYNTSSPQGNVRRVLRTAWKYRITVALVAINIIVHIVLSILGNTEDVYFMLQHGAMYPPNLLENGEYWRLLTATFMHFGFLHILNNMVILAVSGQILEEAMGHIKYLILYLLSGIFGMLVSYLQMLHSGEYSVAAGASGAIFGIIGALLWIVIRHKGRYESLTGRGLLFMIVICLYYGVVTAGVDNYGHIGGLVGGFLLGILLYRKKQPQKQPRKSKKPKK